MTAVAERGVRRWSLLRRCLLRAAGVDCEVLALCPTEVEKYSGLGAAVLISSVMAAVSGSVAVATALAGGRPSLGTWLACAPVGAVYGAIVFSIDRFLVSSSLGAPAGTGAAGRAVAVARTLAGLAPRLLLAVVIGLLVAEPLMLVVFRPEVDQRVAQVQAAEADREAAQIEAGAEAELDRIDGRTDDLAGADPAVVAATEDLAEVDDEISSAGVELAELQVTLRSEISGVSLSDGGTGTSGQAGDGPVADQVRAEIDLVEARLEGLAERRDAKQAALEAVTAGGADDEDAAAEVADLAAQRRAVEQQRRDDLAAVDVSGVDGLLVRVEALEWLTRHRLDTTADTTVEDGAEGDSEAAGGLTTIGVVVWLVRLWLLTLDAIPVGFKAVMALRRHRPYEALVAAHQAVEMNLAGRISRSTPSLPAHLAVEPEPARDKKQKRPRTAAPGPNGSGRRSGLERVRRVRDAEPGITQVEIAKRAGLTPRQVSRLVKKIDVEEVPA